MPLLSMYVLCTYFIIEKQDTDLLNLLQVVPKYLTYYTPS